MCQTPVNPVCQHLVSCPSVHSVNIHWACTMYQTVFYIFESLGWTRQVPTSCRGIWQKANVTQSKIKQNKRTVNQGKTDYFFLGGWYFFRGMIRKQQPGKDLGRENTIGKANRRYNYKVPQKKRTSMFEEQQEGTEMGQDEVGGRMMGDDGWSEAGARWHGPGKESACYAQCAVNLAQNGKICFMF